MINFLVIIIGSGNESVNIVNDIKICIIIGSILIVYLVFIGIDKNPNDIVDMINEIIPM
jgi:hypothetical protein